MAGINYIKLIQSLSPESNQVSLQSQLKGKAATIEIRFEVQKLQNVNPKSKHSYKNV